MENISKYRGGYWLGYWSSTWPSGLLEISPEYLGIKDEVLKKDFRLQRSAVERVEARTYIPVLFFGIKIILKGKTDYDPFYFWYAGISYRQFVRDLVESGWLEPKKKAPHLKAPK